MAIPTLTTLAAFNGNNASDPQGGLVADASGNLYGATYGGGSSHNGTIYELAGGTRALTILASFNNLDGGEPEDTLIADVSGNLYGTTCYGSYSGNVFEMTAGTHTISSLVNFIGTNGANPEGGVISDAEGNLYGMTYAGGSSGDGTVFEVAAGSHALTELATFNGSNGNGPRAALFADALGNLYGTTYQGGSSGDGTIFEIAAGTQTLSTLVTFKGTNGAYPFCTLTADASGNIYGTTVQGTVFELAAGTQTLSTLATFNIANGYQPCDGLIIDATGDLFGTTKQGGSSNDGTIFEVAAGTNTITTLVNFNGANGATPYAGLIADASGNLYGTTTAGGSNSYGTVFELTNTGFAVPEPGSLTMVGVGCLALLRRRRRDSRGRRSVGASTFH